MGGGGQLQSVLLLNVPRYKHSEGTGFGLHMLREPDWEETGAFWQEIFQKQNDEL